LVDNVSTSAPATPSAVRLPEPRILALDGLRGAAVSFVLIYHYSLPYRIPFGWSGVDLFFVLSGFLISGILLRERGSDCYFGTFYRRRAARIIPAYAILLAVKAILKSQDPVPVWTYLTSLQNWFMNFSPLVVWNVTWSVAIEEQFYVILAPIVRKFGKHLGKIAVGMIVLSVSVRLALQASPGALYFTICRLDGLGLGILCMLALRTAKGSTLVSRYSSPALCTLGLGMAVLACVDVMQLSVGIPASIVILWVGGFYASLLLWVLSHPRSRLTAIAESHPLREMGRLSYFVYLFHQLFLVMFASFSGGIWQRVAACLATLFCASLSWQLIERPALRWARRFQY
jgi:peptidoglycan/LPS O-acetylase OafA/YrhL